MRTRPSFRNALFASSTEGKLFRVIDSMNHKLFYHVLQARTSLLYSCHPPASRRTPAASKLPVSTAPSPFLSPIRSYLLLRHLVDASSGASFLAINLSRVGRRRGVVAPVGGGRGEKKE